MGLQGPPLPALLASPKTMSQAVFPVWNRPYPSRFSRFEAVTCVTGYIWAIMGHSTVGVTHVTHFLKTGTPRTAPMSFAPMGLQGPPLPDVEGRFLCMESPIPISFLSFWGCDVFDGVDMVHYGPFRGGRHTRHTFFKNWYPQDST